MKGLTTTPQMLCLAYFSFNLSNWELKQTCFQSIPNNFLLVLYNKRMGETQLFSVCVGNLFLSPTSFLNLLLVYAINFSFSSVIFFNHISSYHTTFIPPSVLPPFCPPVWLDQSPQLWKLNTIFLLVIAITLYDFISLFLKFLKLFFSAR